MSIPFNEIVMSEGKPKTKEEILAGIKETWRPWPKVPGYSKDNIDDDWEDNGTWEDIPF
jgi:hypothetical protein